MASRRVPAAAVVRYFHGQDGYLSEVFMEGSDDDLGMEDEFSDSSDESSNEEEPHTSSHMYQMVKHKFDKMND